MLWIFNVFDHFSETFWVWPPSRQYHMPKMAPSGPSPDSLHAQNALRGYKGIITVKRRADTLSSKDRRHRWRDYCDSVWNSFFLSLPFLNFESTAGIKLSVRET